MVVKQHSFSESYLLNRFPFLSTVFRGIGQIMLQNNAFSGLILLAGIFYGSVYMGLAAFLAATISTLTAKKLNFDSASCNQGLYGFSATLVGVALVLFFKSSWVLWFLIIVLSACSAILQNWFIKKNLPVFTFPFVFITWIILLLTHYLEPSFISLATPSAFHFDHLTFGYMLRGYGQVIFQDSLVAGIVFFIAVAIESPVAALYGLVASAITGLAFLLYDAPISDIEMGLHSFNAVLTAIAFAGTKKLDVARAFYGVVLTLLVQIVFFKASLLPLTFPFVAGSFLVTLVQRTSNKRK